MRREGEREVVRREGGGEVVRREGGEVVRREGGDDRGVCEEVIEDVGV